MYDKLRDAFNLKLKDPKAPISKSAETLSIPNVGLFHIFIEDWGAAGFVAKFDGIGVDAQVSSVVELQGDQSHDARMRAFYVLLNTEHGLRQIQKYSISGIRIAGSSSPDYRGLLATQKETRASRVNADAEDLRRSPERQPAPSPPPSAPSPAPSGPPQSEIDAAIAGLRKMGFNKRDAAAMVAGVEGNTADEIIQNALKAHGQAKTKRTEAIATLGEQGTATASTPTTSGTMGTVVQDPAGGDMPPAAFPESGLKNGVWYHIPSHRDFPVNDEQWSASPADAPILALGHNLTRLLNSDGKAAEWYDENPPPMRPKEPVMYPAYARAMRSYLKKLALQAIENWGWILFWHGYLYTNGVPINFKAILELGNSDLNTLGKTIHDEQPIAIVDANNQRTLVRTTWGQLKNSNRATASAFTRDDSVLKLERILQNLGRELLTDYPSLVQRYYRTEGGIRLALFRALCETTLLTESLTYNQMLTATARYWRTRLRTVRQVHTQPPALVMMQDGTVDLAFDFESKPSTEGRPHRGYVKFVPEKGGTNWLDKLKDLLGKAAKGIQRFFGKKVPPQILKGSDLRKMLVEVSCDCKDFKYRMSWANVKAGVTTAQGRTDNGQAPVITNPGGHPGFCKHILATVRYLTDDAELTVSAQFSRQQQEALARDRARFMKEAEAAYERMEAPEAPEEEKPEEEEPEPGPEFARLPAPPKPVTPAEPPSPAAPQAPPPPSYQSLQ